MKVSIDIDEDLMRRARRLTGLRTKREVIQRALQTLVQLKEGRRRPGSAKGEIQVVSPYAFESFDEWPIHEILEWLPYLFTDAEIRKLRRADPKLSPRQVLKPPQRVIGVHEGRVRAERLMKANRELFRRLAGGPAPGEPSCAELAGDLVGSFRGGPRDLSTNKRYLEEAILADHFKGRRNVASGTIKRTVKAYGKTLRKLASSPRRTKKG